MKLPKIDILTVLKPVGLYVDEHKPAFLAGLGLACSYMATISAAKAGVDAHERIDDAMRLRSKTDPDKEFTKIDTIKVAAPAYVRTVLWSGASTFCIVGSTKVARKRELAAWGAYKLAQETYANYKDTVAESLGAKKSENLLSKADKKLVEAKEIDDIDHIPGTGNVLCIDAMSGRVFKTSIDRIKRAEAVINQRLYEDIYVSLNEFYYEIDLDENDMGELIGWHSVDCPIHIDISTQQLPSTGEPCLVIRSDSLTTRFMSN